MKDNLPYLPDIEGYWYLASPYSKYEKGIEKAFTDICLVTGRLISQGVPVYSPIAHTHPIAIHASMDPHDHTIWMAADRPMMDAAGGLIVCKMPGWDESYGVGEEINHFEAEGQYIVYLDWEDDDELRRRF